MDICTNLPSKELKLNSPEFVLNLEKDTPAGGDKTFVHFNCTLSFTTKEADPSEYVNSNDLHKNCPNSSKSGSSIGSLKSRHILVQLDESPE